MRSIEELMQAALALSGLEREILAERLIESLAFDTDGELLVSWVAEARGRLDEVRSGVVMAIDGDEALTRVRFGVSRVSD
jgi:Putative addiction module component